MAESLLLPVVRGVAGKAADVLVQTVTRMCGVDDDRCKLERQLLAVQCKLADAEVKSETNPYVRRWMKDFRTVAYEAGDVLDDFQYEAMRREAQIGSSKTRKVLSHFTNHSPLLFRLAMSRKLSNVLEKINKLVVEMNTFGLVENRADQAPQVLYRQTHSALDESTEIFGRGDDKEVVVKLLLDQQDQHKVQVLPIFGMGGLGKTTLAKMVYNDRRVQQHFQLNMWHCVSENFNATTLVKSVIELATNGRCDLPDTIELLRRRLDEVIGQKRFLLILDDVWNEDDRKWEDELKTLLCSVGGPGSVVVVTCRSQQVASIMGTLGPHKLACLSEDDSWELFSKKAFSKGVDEQTELVIIGRRIVKKCKGLPLALKMMGGLMSSKQQMQEWEAIEQSDIGDNARGKDEILPILKLSYQHLTSEMKQCFAFCAVFPKDYEMEKDILIQLWMANGFLEEEITMDLTQKGEFIFHYLVWRSFLQDVKVGEFSGHGSIYKLTVCQMHDLMHDLAKDITDECATVEELIQLKASLKDACHMQVAQLGCQTGSELEQISGSLKGITSLYTLLRPLSSNKHLRTIAPLASRKDLKEFKLMSLRALSYEYLGTIHNQVINAKHLRYLDLSRSNFVRLPDSISMLYNLETLRLIHCSKLQRLPDGISALRKLIHLYLFGCDHLERMPPNINLLRNLCTLTTFVVGIESGCGIEELRDLYYLGNKLQLYNLRKIMSGKNAKEANLHQKQNIRELLLCWGRGRDDMLEDEIINEEEVLEALAPHSKLETLELYGYGGLEISQWMGDPQMFRCLRKLYVSSCQRCKTLPVVWLSHSLEYLDIKNMVNLTTLCKSTKVEAEGYNTPLQFFPKLKQMVLHELPNLERLVENRSGEPNMLVMFPLLESVTINKCPKLASVPGSPVLEHLSIKKSCSLPISALAHLTTLSQLSYDATGLVSTSMPFCSWPSLVTLQVTSLASLTVRLEDQQSESQSQRRSLETLRDLSVRGPNCFVTTSGLSKLRLVLWECFTFVEEMCIFGCDDLIYWPTEEFQRLVRLRTLRIWKCDKLQGKGSSSDDEALPLPQLERLHIQECRSLLEIPKLPACLEELDILFCTSLVAVAQPLDLGDLPNLRKLSLNSCDCLKALPDGMDGLTSIERLDIICCPDIEEFPQGLLQRLPALKSLCVQGCPELRRRCREGGEYFSLLSSIPEISIPEPWRFQQEETGSSMKKLVRRLLPSCADS